jgi:hypothetical protein
MQHGLDKVRLARSRAGTETNMKTKKPKTYRELLASVRRTWHGVNPATKVFRDKTKYNRKVKHKHKRPGE